jgi:LysM repeat protein
MNTPSPLVPQGTTPSRNKSTIRIAFFTILIVHVVFIGGLLIQGCTKDNTPATPEAPAKTNADATMPANGDIAATAPQIDTTTTTAPVGTTTTALPTGNPVGATATPQPIAGTTTTVAPLAPKNETPVTTGATREYTIAKGDMLATIAKKNGVTLKALQDANPGLNALRLQIGQKIQIPAGSASVATSTTGASEAATAADGSTYTVKSGDRLEKIAKSHGTTVKAIASLNGLKSINSLKVGQKLKLPMAKSDAVTAPAASAPAATSSTPMTTAAATTGTVNN